MHCSFQTDGVGVCNLHITEGKILISILVLQPGYAGNIVPLLRGI